MVFIKLDSFYILFEIVIYLFLNLDIIFIFILKGKPIFDEKHPAIELLIKSTNAGLFALTIALFAYIDLVLPVFWFVLLIHFIFNDPSLD